MKLYELTIAARRLAEHLDATGGEMDEAACRLADQIDADLVRKVDGMCRVVAELRGEAEVIKAERDRLGAMLAAKERAVQHLRDYLHTNLKAMKLDKVKTPLFTAYVQASPPSVVCDVEPHEVPLRYQRVTIEVDRTAVLKDHKDGLLLPAGISVRQSTHLRIR